VSVEVSTIDCVEVSTIESVEVSTIECRGKYCTRRGREREEGETPTMAETVKSLCCIFSVELCDTVQGELLLFHQNPYGVPHEFLGHFEYFLGHSSREKNHLEYREIGVLQRERVEYYRGGVKGD